MKHVIAYWLLPTKPARTFLADMIHDLAARFDAPIFIPHLTVFIAPENARAPQEVLSRLGAVSIELTTVEIGMSDQFTKTLFIRFEKTAALQQLSNAIGKLSGSPEQDLSDAHVSLLYKYLPGETKSELVSSIKLPFHSVAFRSLCAMHCQAPTQTADEVRAWKQVALQPDE
jgi:hypothetical protein